MSYAKLLQDTRQAFNSGKTRPVEWRKRQLKGMIKLLDENQKLLCEALFKDLHKPKLESLACDIDFVKNEFIGTFKLGINQRCFFKPIWTQINVTSGGKPSFTTYLRTCNSITARLLTNELPKPH